MAITTMKTRRADQGKLNFGGFLAFANYKSQIFLIFGACSTWFLVNGFFMKLFVEHRK